MISSNKAKQKPARAFVLYSSQHIAQSIPHFFLIEEGIRDRIESGFSLFVRWVSSFLQITIGLSAPGVPYAALCVCSHSTQIGVFAKKQLDVNLVHGSWWLITQMMNIAQHRYGSGVIKKYQPFDFRIVSKLTACKIKPPDVHVLKVPA